MGLAFTKLILTNFNSFFSKLNSLYRYEIWHTSSRSPAYDNEKENWRILTNKEIYATLKKPTITQAMRQHRLRWFGHVQRMEENRIPKRVLYMNLETTRPTGRP
jgi:hypothetical protein